MAEFWKLQIGDWQVETDDLTLEQEAAYLRVRNAINLYDQPIRDNLRVLAGLWRCNERKATRLRQELIEAGLIVAEDGCLTNETAMHDVSNRRALRVERASSGRRGGIESGKVRAKALKNNNAGEARGSTREEKRREEDPPTPQGGSGSGADHPSLQLVQPQPSGTSPSIDERFDEFWKVYPRHEEKKRARDRFARILKAGEATSERIVAGARAYAAQMQAEGRDRSKVKHPTTWLNGACWEDDFTPPRPPASEAWRKGLSLEEQAKVERIAAERKRQQG